ncbi:MAG: hypothetical protein LBQ79_00500 [Deltaproteobacteria bacterium]|jgi:hypothetical protein|nr:hypothetical protein [Deltaproteobacteria bacterium]
MTILAASLAVLAALSAFLPALVPPALAEAGRTRYDSAESVPEPWTLAFTVSYPSFFARVPPPAAAEALPPKAGRRGSQEGSPPPPTCAAPPDGELLNLRALQPDRGWLVTLSAGRGTLEPEDVETIESGGYGALWDGLGKAVAGTTGFLFGGARRFLFRGLQASDLHFSMTGGREGVDSRSSLIAQRYVIKGTENLVLACRFDFPPSDPHAGTFTSRDNPAFRDWGMPFFDSLALKS